MGGLYSLPRGVGCSYVQLEKLSTIFKKIKSKSYVQWEKKNKKSKKLKKKAMYNFKSKN